MKAWLVNLLWDALRIVCWRAHDWVFSPERNAEQRMKNRDWWWEQTLKAERTKTKKDDMRAKAIGIRFKFETPPAAARARGDLKPYPTH